jgi:hypothetical protein
MSLERAFFVGTGYRTLDAADEQTIAVCVQDVAAIACERTANYGYVVCLYSATGDLLAALPWPEDMRSDADAVAWAVGALADAVPWPMTW